MQKKNNNLFIPEQMRTILLSLIITSLYLPLAAQTNKGACSEADFQEQKKAYLIKEAGLTKEEADKFIPLYFEFQELKKLNNSTTWNKAKEIHKNKQASEADYEEAICAFIELEKKNAELEKEYLEKGKNIIPPSKIFKLLHAEIKFNRNMLKIINNNDQKKKK